FFRIAVTVDMVATGTDIKPLECLIFMRDVKSEGYFEQMKGRGRLWMNEGGECLAGKNNSSKGLNHSLCSLS
ncbi:MAG: hypothetical protein HGA87_06390, partial [Desulfobulbaceae bacterium]|nr:hypothetical protein [Desulfobulbaceae bacterium]